MLPIEDALPGLRAALARGNVAVLVAPPGAGKTTRVPLALLEEDWARSGRLIVLEPRRLAARAAAARMAEQLGERVGGTVGLRVRFETKVSAATRIEVVTEGVFARMILDDPGLGDVAGVLFDEFHERSLDADLGLAFARDAQQLFREDLRLLVMSATLDGAAVSALLDGAPVIESEGKSWPVVTHHVSRDQTLRLEDQTARVVRRLLQAETGSILVFLPGQGEIRRVEQRLLEGPLPDDVIVAPLYGAMDGKAQDLAIQPAPGGARKVVLATSIAETSLTIDGVRVVLDCGLARLPRYDPARGVTHLETVRVSRASADQRRGRAGRTAPGVCYRLWDEAQTRALPMAVPPEIVSCDLAGLALSLAEWGVKDPGALALLDPPPNGALAEARRLLTRLGALSEQGDLTPHGKALARLGLPPRLADMVVRGVATGQGAKAAEIAALLTEPGLGGAAQDLSTRLLRFREDRSPRAQDLRRLAARWVETAGGTASRAETPNGEGLLIAHAFPDWVAKARPGGGGAFKLANGRGASVSPETSLARHGWLAIAMLSGRADGVDRIELATPLDPVALQAAFPNQIRKDSEIDIDDAGRSRMVERTRFGELVLSERLVETPDAEQMAAALVNSVLSGGWDLLPWSDGAAQFRARVAFAQSLEPDAGWPDLSDAALRETADQWLRPLIRSAGAISRTTESALREAIESRVPWDLRRRLDRLAPPALATPAGVSAAIDYAAEGGPRADVRVQALFGLKTHPMVGEGRTPLTLALTSPAHRPIQITKDLPGFWAGSWKAVRTEMKGRYPRHPWPEDPSDAPPTVRAKPRGT